MCRNRICFQCIYAFSRNRIFEEEEEEEDADGTRRVPATGIAPERLPLDPAMNTLAAERSKRELAFSRTACEPRGRSPTCLEQRERRSLRTPPNKARFRFRQVGNLPHDHPQQKLNSRPRFHAGESSAGSSAKSSPRSHGEHGGSAGLLSKIPVVEDTL